MGFKWEVDSPLQRKVRHTMRFKRTIVETGEGDTQLTLKELAPVRLIENKFFNDVQDLYAKYPSKKI